MPLSKVSLKPVIGLTTSDSSATAISNLPKKRSSIFPRISFMVLPAVIIAFSIPSAVVASGFNILELEFKSFILF